MERGEQVVFYLHMNGVDDIAQIADFGYDFSRKMCGLFYVRGEIKLTNKNPTFQEKNLFLCSDMLKAESIISGGIRLPILRNLIVKNGSGQVNMKISEVLWLDTDAVKLSKIRLYLKDGNNNIPSVELCQLQLSLLIIKKDY